MTHRAAWPTIPFGDAGKWSSGGTPSKNKPELWSGTIPWVSPKDMKVSRISEAIDHVAEEAIGNGTRLVSAGTLLMVVRGMILAHTFPVAMTTRPVTFNQDVKALRPAPDFVPDFLLYWLQSVAADVLRQTDVANHGTRRLPTELLFAMGVPVPPLPEQRKIAAILSSVDEVIEKTEAVIEQLQVVKKAMMQELLTRGLPGRHTRFKQTEIGEIPEEWDVAELGDLFEIQLGKMLNKAAREAADQLPYLGNRNVQWGRLQLDGLNTMGFSPKDREKFSLRPGDLLVCEGGEVGRTAIWHGEIKDCYFQKALHRLRPLDQRIAPTFMLQYMHHAADEGLFAHLTSRSSIAHLTREKLATARVAVPGIAEQHEIAKSLDILDQRVESESTAVSGLRALKAALMSVLLTGELRVTPDEDAT